MLKRSKVIAVRGHTLPAPHLTRSGYRAVLLYIILPFLGVLLLIDLALWSYFHWVLERCYGIWCLWS